MPKGVYYTKATYASALKEKNPNIKVLSFDTSNGPVKHRCTLHNVVGIRRGGELLKTGVPNCPECRFIYRSHIQKNKYNDKLNPRLKSNALFLKKLKKAHKGRIVALTEYQGALHHVLFKCTECEHEWKSTPGNVVRRGTGCKKCAYVKMGNDKAHTPEWYIEKLKQQGAFITPIEKYNRYNIKIKHQCQLCNHVWKTSPGDIINDNVITCTRCSKALHSRVAIKWLDMLMKQEGIFIQHACNKGEKLIRFQDHKFYVDGYCKETKTVYEFYGDAYHGNLDKYDFKDRPHPYNKIITASQLWAKTKFREWLLQRAGYRVVTIWQSEFNSKYRSR